MGSYVLVYSGGRMPESDEEQAAVMKAWTDWFARLGAAITDPGNPFSGHAKTIGSDGAVRDGSLAPTASGYSVVDADSLDAAVDIAKGCPVLQSGAEVSVYETFVVM